MFVLLAAALLLAVPSPARGAGEGEREAEVSPFGASVRSALFPGWGQLHNGSEGKAVLLFSFQSYLWGRVFVTERRARYYDALRGDPAAPWEEEDLAARYADLRARRRDMVWWSAIVALYAVIDAYVDAHMVGFDEDVDEVRRLTWEVGPAPGGGAAVLVGATF